MNLYQTVEREAQAAFAAAGLSDSPVVLQAAKNPDFGDFQINGVMGAAKKAKQNPRELAQKVAEALADNAVIESAEVAGPGFINLRLRPDFLAQNIQTALSDARFGVAKLISRKLSLSTILRLIWPKKCTSAICVPASSATAFHACWNLWATPLSAKTTSATGVLSLACWSLIWSSSKKTMPRLSWRIWSSFTAPPKYAFEETPLADTAREYVVKLQGGDETVLALWNNLSIFHSRTLKPFMTRWA